MSFQGKAPRQWSVSCKTGGLLLAGPIGLCSVARILFDLALQGQPLRAESVNQVGNTPLAG